METLTRHSPVIQNWHFVETSSLSGEENMRYDADLFHAVEQGIQSPTVRFFQFKEPTVSYGLLQIIEDIRPLVPQGFATVQRPTCGGIVFHKHDLCLSLCWPKGFPLLPQRPHDQYRAIHTIILEALEDDNLRLACCGDVSAPLEPFAGRQCFTQPVGFDVLKNNRKIVGGALYLGRRATLYQGSIQGISLHSLPERISRRFQAHGMTP